MIGPSTQMVNGLIIPRLESSEIPRTIRVYHLVPKLLTFPFYGNIIPNVSSTSLRLRCSLPQAMADSGPLKEYSADDFQQQLLV